MTSADQRLLQQDLPIHKAQPVRIPAPTVVRVTAWMVIDVFIVTAVVVLMARSTGVRFDLFTDYAEILPGQSSDNVEVAGFECGLYYSDDPSLETCSLRPAAGVFSHIYLTRNLDIIDGLIFTPRENALTLGEVALAFGAQRGRHRPRHRWLIDETSVVVWLDAGSFSYFQPVRSLYLYYRPQSGIDQENEGNR